MHGALYIKIIIYVQYVPEDDQDRQKHVGVTTNCVEKIYNFNVIAFVGFIV
jgi:hypothetical protein